MTSLVLLGWAVVVATAAGPVLSAQRWIRSAPRLAVGLWLATEISAVTAVVAAGLLIAAPPLLLAAGLPGIARVCLRALVRLGEPDPVAAGAGLIVAALLVARLAAAAISTFGAARRWRRAHRAALLPVARQDCRTTPVAGRTCWTTVEHATPAAYCLPGRPGQVVVTSAAIAALSAEEFAAVLRHERAHLRGHHHLLVALTATFHHAFPVLPLAAAADAEVRRLVEHLADDRASEQHSRQAVATAIVRLAATTPAYALGAGTAPAGPGAGIPGSASAGTPAGSGGAGAASPVDRVRRMITPAPRPPAVRRAVATGAIGVLLAFPPVVAAASTGVLLHRATCPRGTTVTAAAAQVAAAPRCRPPVPAPAPV